MKEGAGRNQDNSLFGLVEKWKSENIEIVDAEKHLDNVDLKFIDWMKARRHHFWICREKQHVRFLRD